MLASLKVSFENDVSYDSSPRDNDLFSPKSQSSPRRSTKRREGKCGAKPTNQGVTEGQRVLHNALVL
jgi:hypothetical protein